jgi:FtsZ-binding cell division protein ZapB
MSDIGNKLLGEQNSRLHREIADLRVSREKLKNENQRLREVIKKIAEQALKEIDSE